MSIAKQVREINLNIRRSDTLNDDRRISAPVQKAKTGVNIKSMIAEIIPRVDVQTSDWNNTL
jgi:hypothetical protein